VNLVKLYEQFPAAQHGRIRVVGINVYVRAPKNYFGDDKRRIIHLGIHGNGELFLISNSEIDDRVANKLEELGIK